MKTCFLSCLISQSHRIFGGLFLWLRDREIITPAGSSPNSCNIWGCARLMPEQSSSLTCIAETSHLNHQLLPPKVSVSRNLEAAVRAGESKLSILFWNTDILISYLLGHMLVSFVNSERNIFKSRICCSEMLINIEVILSERRICLFLCNGKVDLVCWLSLSPSASKSIPAVRMIVLRSPGSQICPSEDNREQALSQWCRQSLEHPPAVLGYPVLSSASHSSFLPAQPWRWGILCGGLDWVPSLCTGQARWFCRLWKVNQEMGTCLSSKLKFKKKITVYILFLNYILV